MSTICGVCNVLGSPCTCLEASPEWSGTGPENQAKENLAGSIPVASANYTQVQPLPPEPATVLTTTTATLRTDPVTGGQKEGNLEEWGLLPWEQLAEVAKVYGHGSVKYAPHNWTKGYPWTWSVSALGRHLSKWIMGQRTDPHSGLSHLAHCVFHLLTLMNFEKYGRGTDDLRATVAPVPRA